jgi:hypothetical protein
MAFEDTDYPPVEQDEDWYRRMGMSPVGPGGTAPFMRGPAYDTPPVSTGGVPGERPPTTPSPRSARNYDVGEPRDINAPPVGAGAPPVAAAPRGLNLAEDAASGAAAPPVHSNYQAPPVSHGRRALAALAGGMAGYSDPARGYGIARDIVGKPEREADKRFGEDSAQFNEARQEGRQQAVERRQAATAESEIGLRGAQTALEQQKLQDLKDKPAPKEGDKMVHSGFNAQGQAAILWQRADGTTHVETYPDIVQKPAPGNENKTEEEQFITKYMADNRLPDTAANRLLGRKAFVGAGHEPKDTSGRDDARGDRSYQFHSGQLEKMRTPIEARVEKIGVAIDNLNQMSPAADALAAPEILTAMVGGPGSGLRMNDAEISRIIGGRTNWESLKAQLNKWQTDPAKGLSITPAQRGQMNKILTSAREKIGRKQAVIEDAEDKLANSSDPNEHRRILATARKGLDAIDSGSAGQGGGNTTRMYRGGKPYDIPKEKVEDFKKAGGSVSQ